MYYAEYGSCPTDTLNVNCPVTPNSYPKYCLKPSSGTAFSYTSGINGATYGIGANKGTIIYSVTDTKFPNPTVDFGTDWITIGSLIWAKKNLDVLVL